MKREEYRNRTNYWAKRLDRRRYDIVRFRNGYTSDAPTVDVEFLGVVLEHDRYVIKLGKIIACHRRRVAKAGKITMNRADAYPMQLSERRAT